METPNFTKVMLLSKNVMCLLPNTTDWDAPLNTSDILKILNFYSCNYSLMDQPTETDECPDNNCIDFFQNAAMEYGKKYHIYAALTICVFGVISNMINVLVLTRKDLAPAPINRILTVLALTDILIMVDYIPFSYYYYVELPDKMNFPYWGAVYVLFHMHFTQVLHTVSICFTLMLAIWRYLAIGYPNQTQVLCTSRRCNIGIFLSFSLAILLCTPMYLTFKVGATVITEDKKYILYVIMLSDIAKENGYLVLNFWLYAVIIKLLPCCLLTVISIWLIRTLFIAKNRKRMLKNYNACPAGGRKIKSEVKLERQTRRTTKMLVAVLLLFLITEFPQGIFSLIIGMKGKCVFLKCYQYFGEVMDILALFNGSITFILYCWMNKMFRITFGRLFGGNVLTIWRSSGNSEVYTTHL